VITKRDQSIKAGEFSGIRNLKNPTEQPLGSLSACLNFDHTDSKGLERRDGYTLADGLMAATDAYSPVIAEGLYLVDTGSMVSYSDALVPAAVTSGLTDTAFSWAEMDNRVFYAGATDAGVILNRSTWIPLRVPVPDSVTVTAIAGTLPAADYQVSATYVHSASGVAGGATHATYTLASAGGLSVTVPAVAGYVVDVYVSQPHGEAAYFVGTDATTVEITAPGAFAQPMAPEQRDGLPLPTGINALAVYAGRLYAATYDVDNDVSLVQWSGVWFPHLWALHRDVFAVQGLVLALYGTPAGLLIGTSDRVFLFNGETLQTLAQFGVVPGRSIAADRSGRVAVWTNRGVCVFGGDPLLRALQVDKVAVAPGTACHAALVERRGREQFLVTTDGGGAPWSAWP
jgi:hypothetical protein